MTLRGCIVVGASMTLSRHSDVRIPVEIGNQKADPRLDQLSGRTWVPISYPLSAPTALETKQPAIGLYRWVPSIRAELGWAAVAVFSLRRLSGGVRLMLPGFLAALSLLAVSFAMPVSTAHASPASEFRYRFQQGVEALKRGRLEEALDRFLLAHRLAPNPNTIRNIALCLEKLGRYYEAFSFYQELASVRGLDRDNAAFARAALVRLSRRVARLRVTTNPPGATIYLDRKALGAYGRTPVVVAQAPGRHIVFVEKSGFHPEKRPVRMVSGSMVHVDFRLRPVVGTLEITSSPPGAEVRLDEDNSPSLGTTPFRLKVSPGRHVILFSKSGYEDLTHRVSVLADETRRLAVTLRPMPVPKGILHVQANVLGAVVSLDGRPVGMTPLLRTDIGVGSHKVSVTSPGRIPWKSRLTVRHDAKTIVMVQLERRPRRNRFGPWPWVSLGVSTALLAATVTLAGLSHSSYLNYEQAEEPTASDLTRGRRLAIAADSVLGTFLVSGLATALTFFFLKPDRYEPSQGSVRSERLGTRP